MNLENLIIVIISYLIGSIPWAFIIVKVLERKDIRKLGTGNVGAMNSFESTGKRLVGILVLLMDLLKGLLAVLITDLFFQAGFMEILLSSTFVVLGHNYSVFLKFKGGRGIASAVGVSLYLNPLVAIVWLLLYFICNKLINNHVHVGSIFATVLCPVIIFFIPDSFINYLMLCSSLIPNEIFFISATVCFVILLKHIEPFIDLMKGKA